MPKKRLRDLPVEPLFEGTEIPTVRSEVLQKSYKSLPPIMRMSLKSLSSIYPIDIGEFAHRHRRLLVLDRNTVEVMRTREYLNNPYLSGFVYCYCFEDNLTAGHFTEEHSDGFLFFKKRWETDHYLPNIKIGCSTNQEGDVGTRVLQQFTSLGGQNVSTGHSQRAILLFLMYSPIAAGIEGVGLERSIHRKLKDKRYWLRRLSQEDPSPSMEWFEAPLGEVYSIAYEENMRICNQYAAQTGAISL